MVISQSPVLPSLLVWLPAQLRTVSGIRSSDEAKIGGMTPRRVELDWKVRPFLLNAPRGLPLGYWISTRRCARSMKQMNRMEADRQGDDPDHEQGH